ncbi:hypothetical protein EBU02_10405 [bacterium]|nr:hypothetical protein [bacterium]
MMVEAMSSLAAEIDRVLQNLDAPRASRLERVLRDSLALALRELCAARGSEPVPAKTRREQFSRRFAPLTSQPARDLDDILSENRGGA